MAGFTAGILNDVLLSFYQQFGAALLTAVLFMYVYMHVKKYGGKETVRAWFAGFRREKEFRKVFLLAFYTMMILFKTLLCRSIWVNPLSDVLGTWGLYDSKGQLYLDNIENLMLFVPFAALFLWMAGKRVFGERRRSPGRSLAWAAGISFFVSLGIELLQLFLKLGTFQVSDLFFNTLGGAAGGLLYWVLHRLRMRLGRGGRKIK